jgi:hypothetical protein
MLTFETLDMLARSRRERLLSEAVELRLAMPLGRRNGLRISLARASRELGLMFLVLGEALAERPAAS